MKCIKCGCENLDGTERCKNCEYPLIQTKSVINESPDRIKNQILFFIFGIWHCFIIPLILFVISDNQNMPALALIVNILSIIYHLLGEIFTCLSVNKIVKNNYKFSECLFIYEIFALIIYGLALFIFKEFYLIILGIIGAKAISWFIAKKFVIREKIKFKPLIIGIYIIYLLAIFIIPNLLMPTKINKFLYLTFGNSQFSSKELTIQIIEQYNNGGYSNEITYFHKFREDELKEVTTIKIKNNFNNDDINKFPNIEKLEISNYDGDIIFGSNNLRRVDISKSKIDEFKITSDSNLSEVYIEETEFKNINVINTNNLRVFEANNVTISDAKFENNIFLKDVEISKSNVDKILFNNNKSLKAPTVSKVNIIEFKNMSTFKEFLNSKNDDGYSFGEVIIFKKLVYDDKKISFSNNEYILFDGIFRVKENSKVKDLLLENLTAKVYDYYHEIISCDDGGSCYYDSEQKIKEQFADSTLTDHIELYENGNLIYKCSVLDLDEIDLKR